LILALLVCVVGCPGERTKTSNETSEPGALFAGQTLEVSMPSDQGFSTLWQILLDEWAAQTGAAYRLREYPPPRGDERLPDILRSAEISSQESRSDGVGGSAELDARVVFFPITRAAELVDAGVLSDVPEGEKGVQALDWLDLFRGLRDNVAAVGPNPALVPISCPVLVCYYRGDLLERAGISPPETWEEYQRLVGSIDEWAPGLTAVEPWDEEFRATMFLARAAAYGKHPGNYSFFFDIKSGEPRIGTPGFVRALEMSRNALATMPHVVRSYSPADCRREFFAGRAAMTIAFETGPGNPRLAFGPAWPRDAENVRPTTAEIDVERPESMKVAFTPLPGSSDVYNLSTGSWESSRGTVNRVTLTAFAGFCGAVSAGREGPSTQAAWNLLEMLTLDNLSTTFPDATKSLCRSSHVADPGAWAGDNLAADEMQEYVEAIATSLQSEAVVAELPVVGYEAFRTALSTDLGGMLSPSEPAEPATVLEATNHKWRAILQEIGPAKVRASYRRSLGLSED
jgi:multiple sugar transport system substrate-binding protein